MILIARINEGGGLGGRKGNKGVRVGTRDGYRPAVAGMVHMRSVFRVVR